MKHPGASMVNAVVSVVIAAAAALAPVAPAAAACATTPVPAVAHRGGTEKYVENTRNAFRYASSVGVNRWELDVQFDSTGVPFVMHDATLDRTTNWTGPVAAYDLSAARSKGLRTDDGQYVPSLYEVLSDASARGAQVLVELKADSSSPPPTAAELDRVIARIGWTNMRSRVVVMSFNTDALKAFQARPDAAGIATGLVENPSYEPAGDITALGVTWFIKHKWSLTAGRLDEWSGPLKVAGWTMDSTSDWKQANGYRYEPGRLDGVITNRPAAYQAYIRTLGC